MADFESASQVFLAWLQQVGAEISPKIKLEDLRQAQAGRGVGKWLFLEILEAVAWLYRDHRGPAMQPQKIPVLTRISRHARHR